MSGAVAALADACHVPHEPEALGATLATYAYDLAAAAAAARATAPAEAALFDRRAEDLYRQALAADPRGFITLVNLAALYRQAPELGHVAEVFVLLERAVSLRPRNSPSSTSWPPTRPPPLIALCSVVWPATSPAPSPLTSAASPPLLPRATARRSPRSSATCGRSWIASNSPPADLHESRRPMHGTRAIYRRECDQGSEEFASFSDAPIRHSRASAWT